MKPLLLALALASPGCASVVLHRCTTQIVPMYWADGTVTTWTVKTCRSGQ